MATTQTSPRLPSLAALASFGTLIVVVALVALRHALVDPRFLLLLLGTGIVGLVLRWAWPALVVVALVAAVEVRVTGHPFVAGWREEPLGPLAFGLAAVLIAYLSAQLRYAGAARDAGATGLELSLALAPLWPALGLTGLLLVPYRAWMPDHLELPRGVVYFASLFLLAAAVTLALWSVAGYRALALMEPRQARLALREILQQELGADGERMRRARPVPLSARMAAGWRLFRRRLGPPGEDRLPRGADFVGTTYRQRMRREVQ